MLDAQVSVINLDLVEAFDLLMDEVAPEVLVMHLFVDEDLIVLCTSYHQMKQVSHQMRI